MTVPEDAVLVVPESDDTPQAGMLAMARLPEAEFQARVKALKTGQERIRFIKRELMEDGSHYGVIPGTKKPTLLKPGAEVLCSIYGLRPDFLPRVEYGDAVTAPAVRVTMRCELHLGDLQGPVVAVGVGEANSWETKYRYREGERVCPECGVVGSIIRGKREYGGGWLCWAKRGGCGFKWPDGTAVIEQQEIEKLENPDQHSLANTLLKMAKKRAHIDAALTGTASSDLFTQDLEDEPPPPPDKNGKKPAADDHSSALDDTDNDGFPINREAHEKHGVEPARQPAKDVDPGPKVAKCPACNGKSFRSKWPKPGATYYCTECAHKFDLGGTK